MIQLIRNLNFALYILFLCFYAYQAVYVLIRFFKKMPVFTAKKNHKYAVLIAARNEESVIGDLLESINSQDYPSELIDTYVIADNCTDHTAAIAQAYGAKVIIRHNLDKIGKGFALNYAFNKLDNDIGIEYYEGYMVFDADNIIDKHFVKEINAVFDDGYRVVTSYRNSKNYDNNWISSGYALWFLRESKYLNGARMLFHTSCAISGTGFLVSSEIIKSDTGWKYHLLTEDIEFTIDKAINKELIGYSERSVLYDEQPIDFKTSWNQRMRWTKGFYQVMKNYGVKLLVTGIKNRSFQCYDMFATVAPATLLTISMFTLNLSVLLYGLANNLHVISVLALNELVIAVVNMYLSLFAVGLLTLATEWKNIQSTVYKKIYYLFTFPLFMFTYGPIAIAALFSKVTWKPIKHTYNEKAADIRR